ncbi:hypothetical protein JCGZ_14708 [Jatropha curcas]|uniref:Rx N-terminal domain-containing protein n=1 Tax=Jatropha curcas TaxID=180498 RepID=A0A067KJQ9_JATCU|nr:hypothetical protein JCGZ_14708 [Jatropha curcas]
MAEAFLSNLVTKVASKLVLPAIKEAKLWWRTKEEFNKLEETVLTVQGVLIDAEEQYSQSHQVRVWVDSLKQAFYDADDLLDDFSTEEVRKFPYSVKMAYKIKKIRRKLNAIAENRKFHLDSNRHENIDFMNIHDGTDQIHSSLPEIVIGRGDDKDEMIQFLLSSNFDGNTSEGETKLDPLVSENVLIVSIVGIRGASGSRTIVTTRLRTVAYRIRSNLTYELRSLSEEESWSLFKQMAFKQGKVETQEHELVGREIVAKCAGVPLAIRAIGRLLYMLASFVEC